MAPPLLLLQDITLTLGGKPLLDGAGFGVSPGERLCLVGRNGSGKSTLLRIAAGELQSDSGKRFLQPGTTVRYLAQEPDLSGFKTTLDYVLGGLGPNDEEHRAPALLSELGLTGSEDPKRLSGGEARRAALARALAPSPDLLLLDEPTNHLDMPAIEWLERELTSLQSAMVIISHDRRLLETLSRSVVWLDRGTTRRLDQGFARFESWREEVLDQEERDAHKLDRQIAREEDWIRHGVSGRRKRNVRRVGELAALRQTRQDTIHNPQGLKLEASGTGLSGKLVAVAEGMSKSYGDRPIVQDLDLRVLRGDRLGIVGSNGAGKSTLLRLLTGLDKPDSGKINVGKSLSVVTLDQQRQSLDANTTLSDTLTGGGGDTVLVGTEKRHVIGYMKDFLFRPEQARTPVGVLSGGERGRLMLACALARPSNLLVLDEPTNDLDLETLDLLQDMLAAYPGTVLLVSHDRDFLDRVATSVLAAAGGGRWTEYAGGYSDMVAQGGGLAGSSGAPAKRGNTPGTRSDKSQPRKMSFKDKHALAQLPGEIAAHEAEIWRLRSVLADANLYRRDPTTFAAATDLLTRTEALLTAAEERWLQLETMREALGTA
ncbi:ABC-F family ATP-binding cassette domain-containing protein [Lichenicola cladoniae]|uniref:ABC-F family ATP-binding cassette domain-containing protein n=1 Tax=Lichenicola cladoniae TaxID=1484109 RepID=A0A6M8HN71_9PROT|nr:ABC-F family ATP-binding cassette domain-containing protein [Lichenicola cladoniae]NPD67377.1 ABC-F family ATP-binding cassette domain-containing protein [Acetobacteraceae bacterium]QKE89873.1 ABC-F family ATP-binding cassette domain-containing protein [Lichenicola cladoniae]